MEKNYEKRKFVSNPYKSIRRCTKIYYVYPVSTVSVSTVSTALKSVTTVSNSFMLLNNDIIMQ